MQLNYEACAAPHIEILAATLTGPHATDAVVHGIVSTFIPSLLKAVPGYHGLLAAVQEQLALTTDPARLVRSLGAEIGILRAAKMAQFLNGELIEQALSAEEQKSKSSVGKGYHIDRARMETCLMHDASDLALSTLEFLVLAVKPTDAIQPTEVALLRTSVQRWLKASTSSLRQRTMHLFRALCTRLYVSTSAFERYTMDKRTPTHELKLPEWHSESIAFLSWFHRTVLGGLYPGAPFERYGTSLEVYNALLDVHAQFERDHPGAFMVAAIRGVIADHAGVAALQFALHSTYDASRQLLSQVIHKVTNAAPPSSFDSDSQSLAFAPGQLQSTVSKAEKLCKSPRVTEYDAGARMLLMVRSILCMCTTYRVSILNHSLSFSFSFSLQPHEHMNT
jgi:hypothetical protein